MVSDRPLDGQVAVVTGGASGIGRATVLALAAAGAQVAVVDRETVGAERVVEEVTDAGGAARAFIVDLADAGALEPAVDVIVADLGRIDILVNSAGTTGTMHGTLDVTAELFDGVIAVNLRAPTLLTRFVGAHMIERGGGGRIVNLSSSAGFRAMVSPVVYAASKAGINGLTRAAAADLGPHGVNVNAVAPGMTKTPMTAMIGGAEVYEKIVRSGPLANLLQRPSEATDVANVILFLCLPASRQITGQVLHTSAGQVV